MINACLEVDKESSNTIFVKIANYSAAKILKFKKLFLKTLTSLLLRAKKILPFFLLEKYVTANADVANVAVKLLIKSLTRRQFFIRRFPTKNALFNRATT